MSEQDQQQSGAEKRQSERLRKQNIKRLIWLGLAFDILLIDQITKWAVMELRFRPLITGQDGFNLLNWYFDQPSILPYTVTPVTSFFNLVMAWNTGVSFSMFSGYGAYMPYILICVALGITAMFATMMWNEKRQLYGLSYALIIGGALGNVLDRARFGAVIDFLDFHIHGYHWPAFNVADIAVVCGISMLIIVSLFFDIKAKGRYRKYRKNKRSL